MRTLATISNLEKAPQDWKLFFKKELWKKNLADPSFVPQSTNIQLNNWQDELCICWIINSILVIARDDANEGKCSFFIRDLKNGKEIEIAGFSYLKFYREDAKQRGKKIFFQVNNDIFVLDLEKSCVEEICLVKAWHSETRIHAIDVEGNTLAVLSKSCIELVDLETRESKKIDKEFHNPENIKITKKYIIAQTSTKNALFDREHGSWKFLRLATFFHATADGELYIYWKNVGYVQSIEKTQTIYSNKSLINFFSSTDKNILAVTHRGSKSTVHSIDRNTCKESQVSLCRVVGMNVFEDIALLSTLKDKPPVPARQSSDVIFLNLNSMRPVRGSFSKKGREGCFSEGFCVLDNDEGSFTILNFSVGRKRRTPFREISERSLIQPRPNLPDLNLINNRGFRAQNLQPFDSDLNNFHPYINSSDESEDAKFTLSVPQDSSTDTEVNSDGWRSDGEE